MTSYWEATTGLIAKYPQWDQKTLLLVISRQVSHLSSQFKLSPNVANLTLIFIENHGTAQMFLLCDAIIQIECGDTLCMLPRSKFEAQDGLFPYQQHHLTDFPEVVLCALNVCKNFQIQHL